MPLSKNKKRGCPTCGGIDAKSCMRCKGKTRLCDWRYTKTGWAHTSELTKEELEDLEIKDELDRT